jgi:hypothetical protein
MTAGFTGAPTVIKGNPGQCVARLQLPGHLRFHPRIGHRVSCRERGRWTVADAGLVWGPQLDCRM